MREIKDNLYPLYECYNQYKLLYEFYQDAKKMKNIDQVKEKIEYLKKNPKLKQKSELETLMWVIGDIDELNEEVDI